MNQITDLLGYAASFLVLLAFLVSDMRRLRWIAIASNLAFIAYAGACGLTPILGLHLLLLPVNIVRLRQLGGDRDRKQSAGLARPRYRRKRLTPASATPKMHGLKQPIIFQSNAMDAAYSLKAFA